MSDLRALRLLYDSDSLDRFVSERLYEARVWSSPRTSDGVHTRRVVECNGARIGIAGRIWDIAQVLHAFWLTVEREEDEPRRVTWTLFFELADQELSPRRRQNLVDVADRADDIAWEHVFSGTADVEGDALVNIDLEREA